MILEEIKTRVLCSFVFVRGSRFWWHFFFFWRCGATRAITSSFLRFLDHTQRRITVGRLLWTSDQPVANTHPCPRWDSNPRSQQASGRRPTPQTARPLGPVLWWDSGEKCGRASRPQMIIRYGASALHVCEIARLSYGTVQRIFGGQFEHETHFCDICAKTAEQRPEGLSRFCLQGTQTTSQRRPCHHLQYHNRWWKMGVWFWPWD